jgi:hypothetical protein
MSGSESLDLALQQLVKAQSTILLSTCIDEDRGRLRQRYAYLAFVFTTGRGTATNWYANADECQWQGVTCSAGQISKIELMNQGLAGSIPADVGLWNSISVFRVFTNGLRGSLPSSIGRWTGLTNFFASNNQLNGALPSVIGKWTALKIFTVLGNQLGGSLPSTIGAWTGLTEIYLRGNQFTGAVPKSVSNWTALEMAYFNSNSFTGIMPPVGNTFCPKNTSIGVFLADCAPFGNSPPAIICKCCSRCCASGFCFANNY